jgi:organic radical activating enzyme
MAMVQYGIWPSCSNQCKFCLIRDKNAFTKEQMMFELNQVIKNIDYIDWKDQYSHGISLLGGELYYITDQDLQDKFLELIDVVIEKILKVSTNPNCRYSSVTNGIYDSTFLYKVIDKIANSVGVGKVDINFSYDFKYRYASDETRILAEKNINDFHSRYNYVLGIQMILTQYVINMALNDGWRPSQFINETFPGNQLAFLYPHPIHRGQEISGEELTDFNFTRSSLMKFLRILENDAPLTYRGFIESTKNSAVFKHTGLFFKGDSGTEDQTPVLSDGKELLNSQCGHSILYQCYSDSDRCMLCDLTNID